MEEIVRASEQERIFYLHDFIYFVESINYAHPISLKVLVCRVLELLLLFDKILIPAEHLNISSSEEQARLKQNFLFHPSISMLIEQRKIITTIWSACRDTQDHLDATARYKVEIGASIVTNKTVQKNLPKIQVFWRDQKSQSGSALVRAKENGWKYGNSTEDFLSYRDGPVEIPFSHERLILGDAKDKFTDPLSLNAAKLAYIQAMPSGNGGIFRALVPSIETTNGEGSPVGDDRLPPALFTPANYRAILSMTSINMPVPQSVLLNPSWPLALDTIRTHHNFKRFQDKVFGALEKLSEMIEIRTESDAKEALKLVKFVRLTDVVAISWPLIKEFIAYAPVSLVKRIAETLSGKHQEFYVFLPIGPALEANRCIASLDARS
ncbi:MAG: hypothetical protein HGB15_03210 [Chlorobaculum sp.]|nr:hypothetical protein [Chlorobaculum sp.]